MKRLILSLLFIGFLFYGCQKEDEKKEEKLPEIVWEKSYGGSESDLLYSMKPTPDKGYVLYGHTLSSDGDVTKRYDLNDLWLVKIDSVGNIEWQNTYGGSKVDLAIENISGLEVASDGGYLIVGSTGSDDGVFETSCSITDGFLIKLDRNGNPQWTFKACGDKDDYIMAVTEQKDGSIYVVGHTSSDNGNVKVQEGNLTDFIIKFTPSGSIQWIKYIGGIGSDMLRSIEPLSDGNLIVAGGSKSANIPGNSNDGTDNIYLLKISSQDGSVIWQKCIDYGYALSVKEDNEGNIVVVANNNKAADNHGSWDFYVVKVDGNGNVLNKKSYGGGSSDFVSSIFVTPDNDYLIAGEVSSNDQDVSGNHGDVDIWLLKVDSDLKMIWQKCLGSPGLDGGFGVSINNEGQIAVAGYVGKEGGDVSFIHGDWDYWVCVLK